MYCGYSTRAFMTKYKIKKPPNRSSIMLAVKNFEKNGSVTAVDQRIGLKSDKRLEASKELERMVQENGSISSRKAASALQLSQTLIIIILHDDLHLKPYKIDDWHKLEEHDYSPRVDFAQWFLSLPPESENWFICSD